MWLSSVSAQSWTVLWWPENEVIEKIIQIDPVVDIEEDFVLEEETAQEVNNLLPTFEIEPVDNSIEEDKSIPEIKKIQISDPVDEVEDTEKVINPSIPEPSNPATLEEENKPTYVQEIIEEIPFEEILHEVEETEEKVYSLPELVYTIQNPQANSFGFLYPETVASIVDEGEVQIRCSLLTKENLRRLTWLSAKAGLRTVPTDISKWNAVDLVLQWRDKLQKIDDNQVNNVEEIIKNIVGNGENWTLVDVYLYRPTFTWALKWHRALAFVWADEKVYILDPILYYKSSEAHHISTYIAKAWSVSQWFLDPIPYKVSSAYIQAASEEELKIQEEKELEDESIQCVSTMYQDILYKDDYELIDSTKIFQKLFLDGYMELITENSDFTQVQITKDVIIDIPWYPLINIYKNTRITAKEMSLREFMDIQITWFDDQQMLTRSNTWGRVLEFDTWVEVILDQVNQDFHTTFEEVDWWKSNTALGWTFIVHPISGCEDQELKYSSIDVLYTRRNLWLLYICSLKNIQPRYASQ